MYKAQHVFYALGRLRAGYPDFFGLLAPLESEDLSLQCCFAWIAWILQHGRRVKVPIARCPNGLS